MARKNFLDLESGEPEQFEAIDQSTGAPDGDKIIRTKLATGRLDLSFMPIGIVPDKKILVASENLAAGDLINVWDDSGTEKARKADATSPAKPIDGFVLAAVTSGANADVYFEGIITGLTLTKGVRHYLSLTAGAMTPTPITGTGNVNQYAGKSISTSELNFEPGLPIKLA